MSEHNNTETTEIASIEKTEYITSHLMTLVGNYLAKKDRSEFTESDELLASLFSQQAILLMAVNAVPHDVRKVLGEAIDAEVVKLGEVPEEPQPKEAPSNLVVPDRFQQ